VLELSSIAIDKRPVTLQAPTSLRDLSAGAPRIVSLARRWLEPIMEARRRKAARVVADYLRARQDRLSAQYKIELERRLLGR
jgi:hypothetical protein